MSVGTTMFINDGMTRIIRNIVSSMQMLTNAINDTDSALDEFTINSINSKLGYAVAEVDNLADKFRKSEEKAQDFGNTTNNQFNKITTGAKKVATAVVGIWGSIKGLGSTIRLSDSLTQITARLNLMNDNLQTTEELQQKIFDSSQRSRSSFLETANIVASLGQRASDAFASNDETIAFAENLSKMFVVAGASQEEMASASLQLTQALGSGVLRGEELNAVFEAAPNIIQTIADYLDVPIGQIRNMASEGVITADIVKNAVLLATDSINEQFESMPMTFGQMWTKFKNDALMSFQPILMKLNEIGNSQGFQSFVANISNSLNILSNVMIGVFDTIWYTINILEHFKPVIYGVVGAFVVYTAVLIAYNTQQAITNGLQAIASFRASIAAAGIMLQTGATFSATAAQYGFNAALLACPLTWIIIAIVAVIAAFYGLISAINETKGTTLSATGIIVGIIVAAVAVIYNVIADIANFLGNVFIDPIGSIVRLFTGLGDTILGILETIASGIDFIFGTNLANAINSFRSKISSFVNEKFGAGKVFVEKVDILESFQKGHDWTKNFIHSKNEKSNFKGDNIFSVPDSFETFGKELPITSPVLSNIDAGIGDINKNLNSMGDDVKFIKDISEKKYINDYSKKIDQKFYLTYTSKGNENDPKKMLELIKKEIENDIEKSPEGVYS